MSEDPEELSDDELLERIAETDTPLGERCRRILEREGKEKGGDDV
jgi:hypothetical protein